MPTWTLIGSDDFTESSDTNLESHTPSGANALASAWTHLPFQGGFSLVVNAAADAVGQPYHSGSGYRNPYVIGPSANAVQRADCTGIVNGKLGLLLLASSDTTYYKGYLLTHEAFTDRAFRIYRIAAGVATQIKVGATFDGLIDTDTVSFRVDASGNFTVWKNGVQNTELNVTDTTYTTGKPGIHGAKISPNTLDNFSAYHEVGGTQYNQAAAGTLSFSGVALKSTSKQFAGTLSASGATIKATSKPVTGTLSFSGVLQTVRAVLKSVGGTLSFASGTVSRATSKALSGTVSFAGAITKSIARAIAGTLSLSGALSASRVIIKAISGTLSFSGDAIKSTLKSIAGTLSFIGAAAALLNGVTNEITNIVYKTARFTVSTASKAATFAVNIVKTIRF